MDGHRDYTKGSKQTGRQILYHLYVKSKKIVWTYLQNRNRLTDIGNKTIWLPKGNQ